MEPLTNGTFRIIASTTGGRCFVHFVSGECLLKCQECAKNSDSHWFTYTWTLLIRTDAKPTTGAPFLGSAAPSRRASFVDEKPEMPSFDISPPSVVDTPTELAQNFALFVSSFNRSKGSR